MAAVPPSLLVVELPDLEKKYDGLVSVDYLVDREKSSIDIKHILRTTSEQRASG